MIEQSYFQNGQCSRPGAHMKKAALISLVVLNCVMFIVNINAQSLTSAPKPSAEIAGLTKALQGEWSLTGAGSFLPGNHSSAL